VPGQRVGVFEVRSLELVVDLLAIMKAGAAYVPLDPELPMPRLEYQLDNAEIKVVLSRSTLMERLASFGVQTVAVDHLLPGLPQTLNLSSVVVTPDSAAYVIYTSGSTGQPKGVAVPHKGVVNRLLWMQEAYCLETDDCVLQKTPFTFDVSVWEFFGL
jgi:AMP-binding enzyme.